ncbi:hypothetical protein ACTFIW_002797 [Dictyostelium discoideum]
MESINNNLQEIENVNAGELMIENPNEKVSNNNIPKLNLNFENYDLNKLNNNPSSSTELPLSTPRISSVHTILFIREGYYFIKSIAKGGYGEVFLAITKSNKFFAIKVINQHDAIKKDMVEELMVERNILENYQNQSIVKFFESFEKNGQLFIVMEFLHGGDCASLLDSLKTLEEHEAKNIIAQIVNGLEFIHSCGIIHRDLKLDNLIFDKNGIIKIVDFGFSEIGFTGDNGENNNNKKNKQNKKCLGTPFYMSPEVIKNSGYGKTVDWWALGIIIFEMLSGQPPFISKNPEKIFRKINKYRNEIICPTYFSEAATDLIQKLLQVDPLKRLGANGASEVKSHPFFEGVNWSSIYSPESLTFKPKIENEYDSSYFIERKSKKIPTSAKNIKIQQLIKTGSWFRFKNFLSKIKSNHYLKSLFIICY